MEIEDVISALEKTLDFLKKSEDSLYGSLSVDELIRQIESEIEKTRNSQSIDYMNLRCIFAPTGSLQDTSIDNGWGEEFLEIAKIF